jgi:hypothetical protein
MPGRIGIGVSIASLPVASSANSRICGQTFEDLLAAEVAQVEEHAAVDAAAFEDLGPLGARDDVARGQFALVRGVLEHEAFAVFIEEVGALAARRLGEQHAVLFERGRMELDELHVHQRDAGAVAIAMPSPVEA